MEKTTIILAAGESRRMKTSTSKVLLPLLGKPMIEWVVSATQAAGIEKCCIVAGKNLEELTAYFGERATLVHQAERLGTGHAVLQAKSFLIENAGADVLILAGDSPLISPQTLNEAYLEHRGNENAATVISAKISNPFGYGRIVRNNNGLVQKIVEEKDCSLEEAAIDEINSSAYWFNIEKLLAVLPKIKNSNAKGEYYLTDVYELLLSEGHSCGAYTAGNPDEIMGANDATQLLALSKIANQAVISKHLENGIIITNDDGLLIGPDVTIGAGTLLHKGCILLGKTEIGENCIIGADTRIEDSKIGHSVTVNASQIYASTVGNGTKIGPYAHLRPNSHLGEKVKVGNFVEVKNSTVGTGTSFAHLTYIGDSDFGEKINVGCGVVTVNYNGKSKFRTTVESNVFVGCNTNLIAPVVIGEGAYIAAGSTVTENVPKKALAIARARQINKENWNMK